jgi:hypothetical protein
MPQTDDGVRMWCEQAWLEKDQRLERMLLENGVDTASHGEEMGQ